MGLGGAGPKAASVGWRKLFKMEEYTRENLKAFRLWSWLFLLPAEVDYKGLKLKLWTDWRREVWKGILLVNCFQALYFLVMLIPAVTWKEKAVKLEFLTLHAFYGCYFPVCIMINYTYFGKDPRVTEAVLNEVHTLPEEVKRPGITKERYLLATYPGTCLSALPTILLYVFQDCSRIHHLYFLYDQEGRCSEGGNWIIYAGSTVFDSILMVHIAWLFITVYIQLHATEWFRLELELMGLRSRDRLSAAAVAAETERRRFGIEGGSDGYTELRKFQLLLQLFNSVNAPAVFLIKLLFLFGGTLFGYAAFACYFHNPEAAAFNAYLAICIIVTYVVIYDRAFEIPLKMKEVKLGLMKIGGAKAGGASALLKRQLASVRDEGIRVGGFSGVERNSSPVFIDFVFSQIVSLLITF